jgi:hypothetical protein
LGDGAGNAAVCAGWVMFSSLLPMLTADPGPRYGTGSRFSHGAMQLVADKQLAHPAYWMHLVPFPTSRSHCLVLVQPQPSVLATASPQKLRPLAVTKQKQTPEGWVPQLMAPPAQLFLSMVQMPWFSACLQSFLPSPLRLHKPEQHSSSA